METMFTVDILLPSLGRRVETRGKISSGTMCLEGQFLKTWEYGECERYRVVLP